MADFTDILSQYASNKLNQFTQPFTDPNAYFARQLGVGETEEERRRRLEREAAANATPVTQTIKTNPITGEQEMTIKGTPQDLSADNPLTPTVLPAATTPATMPVPQPMPQPVPQPPVAQAPAPTAPVSPQQAVPAMSPNGLPPEIQSKIDQIMPPAQVAPVDPNAPAAIPAPMARPAMAPPAPAARPIIDDQGQVVGQETPQQMVQGAQTNAPIAPTTMPDTTPAQMMPAAAPIDPNARPALAPKFNVPPSMEQMGPSTQLMSPSGWEQRVSTAKNSGDWESIFIDSNTPLDIRKYAAKQFSKVGAEEEEERKANKIINTASELDIAKYLKQRKEEGSWVKAILLQRLGFQKAADDEMSLIRGENKLESMILDGVRYAVETGPKGGVATAFDSTGKKVDDKTLANINANFVGGANSKVFGEAYVGIDSKGNKRVYSKNAAGVYVDDNGRSKPQDVNIAYKLSDDPNAKYDKSFMGAAGTVAGGAAQEGYNVGGRPTPPGATISGGTISGGTTDRIFKREGGYVENDAGKGPTMYGVNSESHPEVAEKIRNKTLTPDEAKRILDGDINKVKGIDTLGPQARELVADAAINQGVGYANNLVTKFGNDAEAIAAERKKDYAALVKANPDKYKKYEKSWNQRVEESLNVTGTGGATAPSVGGPAPLYLQKQEGERKGKRSESFDKIIDEEYRVGGQNGEVVSNNRKQQFDILNRVDPTTKKGIAEEISGLYTAANENPRNQKLTILRDILTGKVVPEKEISNRIAELNISPAAKSALLEYNGLNAEIAAKTLKETAGAGAVSDAEQAANRARNVDITKTPMLGAYNMMSQSQFKADLARYKADRAIDTTAANASVYDRDFRKDQSQLIKDYREITEARLNYINKNGGATNPAAIRDGYKKYPVPQYDPDTGGWKYRQPLDKIFK